MNKNLIQVLTHYSTKSHQELSLFLASHSKESVVAMLVDLMTEYYNDANSSTLREFLIVSLSGFEHLEHKIGYNGYRQSSIQGKTKHYCEAKPKNINTNNWNGKKKLNGGGNFTDYRWERLERDKKTNPTMIVGGFIDGKLIYIFQFRFCTQAFIHKLTSQLQKALPRGDVKNRWLRSANFGFQDYQNAQDLDIKVFVSQKELYNYSKYITKPLFAVLKEHSI